MKELIQLAAITVTLPLLTYGLLLFLFARRWDVNELLNALIKSHLVLFAFIAASTEILSAFNCIDFAHLVGVWTLFCSACVVGLIFKKGPRFFGPLLRPSQESVFLTAAIGFILAATLATALLYPPNNWDSMTYHMARVANWIDHHSVAFYPTGIERQNFSAPLAEFAILHLQVLSGSDLFANLEQWTCFTVLIALGGLIAAELSLNRREQLVTALIIATTPMLILQSTSTQNDLVVTSFVMAFALFMLRLGKSFNAGNILFAALSLGLAIFTKGTAYLYGAGLGLALAVPLLLEARPDVIRLARRTSALALIVLIALALNAAYFVRTCRLYHVPVYSDVSPMANEDRSIPALLSTIPRDLSVHFSTPSSRLNERIEQTLRLVLGKQFDNRRNAYLGIPFRLNRYQRQEDWAGNPIHLFFMLLAAVLMFRWVRRDIPHRNWYAIGVLLAGCLFCMCLKWQPWGSRLQTPLFALAAPIIAIALTESGKWVRRYIAPTALVLMILYCLPFVLKNETRPLLSSQWRHKDRIELYFAVRPELHEPYKKAIELLGAVGARDVGLCMGGDDWEYPLWVMAKQSTQGMRFRHVCISDQSRMLLTNSNLPDYVLATMKTNTWPQSKDYRPVLVSDQVALLRRRQE